MSSHSASPAASEHSRRRASKREELRSHYGIGPQRRVSSRGDVSGAAAGDADGAAGRRAGKGKGKEVEVEGDPLDIDSPAFSAQMYYTNLVTTASLPQLIKSSTQLTSDVKNLNSGRHSLVYNHHHQLFAASQTISNLNARHPELNAIITSLQEGFDEISKLVEVVTVPSGPNAGQEVARSRAKGWEGEGKRMRLMALTGGGCRSMLTGAVMRNAAIAAFPLPSLRRVPTQANSTSPPFSHRHAASESTLREYMTRVKSLWPDDGDESASAGGKEGREVRERVAAEMELVLEEVAGRS